MGVDGISPGRPPEAIVRVPAARAARGGEAADQTVRLIYAETIGEDLLVDTEDGRKLRLSGAAGFAENLSEGDVLLLRVRSSQPTLELEWLGAIAARGARQEVPAFPPEVGMLPAEMAAMRLDQAVLRRLVWNDPAPAVLANAWRALMLGGRHAAAAGVETLGDAPVLAGNPTARAEDGWGTAVYAWRGLPLYLRFVWERRPGGRPAPQVAAGLALLVALRHPVLGAMLMELRWEPAGVSLDCAAEEAPTVTLLRNAQAKFAGVLACAGLRLAHYTVHADASALRPRNLPGARALRQGGAQVPAALFRAAAEIVRSLGQFQLAGGAEAQAVAPGQPGRFPGLGEA